MSNTKSISFDGFPEQVKTLQQVYISAIKIVLFPGLYDSEDKTVPVRCQWLVGKLLGPYGNSSWLSTCFWINECPVD